MSKTFQQWLSWMEGCHPDEIELGLSRCKKVLSNLLSQNFKFPVITVAGTNGKGSTVAVIETIAKEFGNKTLVYTSPHLLDYRERLTFNGQWLSKEQHVQAFEAVEQARGDIKLTYFEYATLAALKTAEILQPDVLILETGLGGRLDAVNVLQADYAIITTVDFDHQDWLGDNLIDIAREKAGIIHENTIAIIADPNFPQEVKDEIKERANKLYMADEHFFHHKQDNDWAWSNKTIGPWSFKTLPFPFSNASAAIQLWSLFTLKNKLTPGLIKRALQNLNLQGRFQKFDIKPSVILDVAHNPQAFRALTERLKNQSCQGKTILVLGMFKDKQIHVCIDIISQCVDEVHLCELESERSVEINSLYKIFKDSEMPENKLQYHPKVMDAFNSAFNNAAPGDRILVTGSFFTVAPVLEHIQGLIE